MERITNNAKHFSILEESSMLERVIELNKVKFKSPLLFHFDYFAFTYNERIVVMYVNKGWALKKAFFLYLSKESICDVQLC